MVRNEVYEQSQHFADDSTANSNCKCETEFVNKFLGRLHSHTKTRIEFQSFACNHLSSLSVIAMNHYEFQFRCLFLKLRIKFTK